VSITGPISSTLSARVSAFHTGRNGTIDDASGKDLNNLNKSGGRAQLYFEPRFLIFRDSRGRQILVTQ